MRSGQIFGWMNVGGRWYGFLNGVPVKLFQEEGRLTAQFERGLSEEDVVRFLDLDADMEEVNRKIEVNDFMKNAIKLYSGIRVLRQNPADVIIEFVCAQNRNISSIQRMILELSKRYGEKAKIDDVTFFRIPDVGRVASAPLKELLDAGLGYRAKYLHNTAKKISSDRAYVDEIGRMSYREALKAMTSGETKLDGVGLKVADCILLYGFHKLEAFPIDVWVLRACPTVFKEFLEADYVLGCGKKLDRKRYLLIGDAARKVFGKYAGYAQLYIYMASRKLFKGG